MAYKMAPKGGNNAKTGHGIPANFRQDGPKQMETIKKIGSAISSANEAGMKAYDASRKPDSYWGGTGRMDTYTKNPVEYVKGFVGNIMSGEETKPKVKTTPKSKGPNQKAKPKVTPKPAPKKEKGFLEKAGDYVSSAVDKVSEALKPGPDPDSRYGEVGDTMFGVKLSGMHAGSYDATKNPLSSEYGKKKGPKQKVAMKNKKAPAKMKKC